LPHVNVHAARSAKKRKSAAQKLWSWSVAGRLGHRFSLAPAIECTESGPLIRARAERCTSSTKPFHDVPQASAQVYPMCRHGHESR
jgi:hypothetical protein